MIEKLNPTQADDPDFWEEALEQLVDQPAKQLDPDPAISTTVIATASIVFGMGTPPHMSGYITYISRRSPRKVIRFEATRFDPIRIGSKWGGAGGHPVLAYPAERLAGKTGTFWAGGSKHNGFLQLYIEGGNRVFNWPGLVVIGEGGAAWDIQGDVSFKLVAG